jgi:hypothetical protein
MPLNALIFSAIWAAVFTFLTTLLEIKFRAQSSIWSAVYNQHYILFVALQLAGNVVSTLIATYLLLDKFPENYVWFLPFIFAFAGVFAFEGVMSNSNIKILDHDVLKFQEWIGKARDSVVARAIKKEAEKETFSKTTLANRMKHYCPLAEIETYLQHEMTADEWDALVKQSSLSPDDHLHKSLTMIDRNLNEAKALVKIHKTPLPPPPG